MTMLVFYARAYSFQGRDGKQVNGNEVHYLESMPAVIEGNERGVRPMQVSADVGALDALLDQTLPALFECELGRQPGAKGKPQTVIARAKFTRSVPIETLLQVSAPTVSNTPSKP